MQTACDGRKIWLQSGSPPVALGGLENEKQPAEAQEVGRLSVAENASDVPRETLNESLEQSQGVIQAMEVKDGVETHKVYNGGRDARS